MVKVETLLKRLEGEYEKIKIKECEELHNDLVRVLHEHKASIQNALMVFELIKFELLTAKHKEIMGIIKLTDKPPLPITGKKKEEKK